MTLVRLAPESTTVTISNSTLNVSISNTTLGVTLTSGVPIVVSTGYNYANLEIKTSGFVTVATSIAAKRVRVLGLAIVAASSVNFYFQSGTSAALGDLVFGNSTNPYALAANGGLILPADPQGMGYFQSTAGAPLSIITAGSTANVACNVVYVYI